MLELCKQNLNFFFGDLCLHFMDEEKVMEYILGLPRHEWKEKIISLNFTLTELDHISQRMGITLSQLISNKIDWKAVKNKFFNPSVAMPDEYLKFPGTYIAVIRSWIGYIRCRFNKETAQSLLEYLQTSRECLRNDDLMVNINMTNHFLGYCAKRLNFTKEHFKELSLVSYQQTKRNAVFKLAQKCTTDKEVLQIITSYSSLYEKNFNYSLNVQGDFIQFVSKAKQEIHDGLKLKYLSAPETVLFKKLTLETMNNLLGLRPLNILSVNSHLAKGQEQLTFLIKENNAEPQPLTH